jgi:hypothetical protein
MHSDSLRNLNGRGGEITAQDHLPKSAPGLRQPRDETRHGNRNLPLEINLITIPLDSQYEPYILNGSTVLRGSFIDFPNTYEAHQARSVLAFHDKAAPSNRVGK